MSKRIDFTNLGGYPLDQDALAFMQAAYKEGFAAIAALCGNKTILAGVENNGANVSSGWIVLDGEIIPFIGGAAAEQVVINETVNTTVVFEDNSTHDVEFTKTATCGARGDFPFTDLQPLLSLQNIWRKGDIKERYCDNDYVTANFDANGIGLNEDRGWQILSYAYPNLAGRTAVNWHPQIGFFPELLDVGGTPVVILTEEQMPRHRHNMPYSDGNNSPRTVDFSANEYGLKNSTIQTDFAGNNQPHDNMPPYYVILKLVKL